MATKGTWLRRSWVLVLASAVLSHAAPVADVNWQTLRGLNLETGAKSPAVQQIDGQVVKIPGFMVPLEDDADQVTEFLLVPYAGACIHVPPPPPNQMVYVKMDAGAKVKVSFTDPIVVTGKLAVATVKSPYGNVSYDLQAQRVDAYQE